MKAAILLPVLLGARAFAAPDPLTLARSALPPGFAASSAFDAPLVAPVATFTFIEPLPSGDTTSVALPPLLERHLSTTDAFQGAAGMTLIAGTLDVNGDGYLVATPPGGVPHFTKIERGMSGSWSDGVRAYRVSLSVNIFRPRLANYIVITESGTGRVVWEKRISELFRLAYKAGEPVVLAGRPYRLFYSQKPTHGLCFIYDDTSAGKHDFKFYMVPLYQVLGATPTAYKMFGGDIVRLRVSPDLATLDITR